MKLRNLLITLGLTLTVGAGVAVATSAKQNEEPKAAEAATENVSCIYMWVQDELGDWDYVYIKFNSVTHPDDFHYKNSFASFIGNGRDGITKDNSGNYYLTLTRTQDWNGHDRKFEWYAPRYISGFNYTYGWANHSDVCYGKDEHGNWNSATTGDHHKDYIYWGNGHAVYSATTGSGSKTISTTYYTVTHNLNSGSGVDTSQKVYQYGDAVNPGTPTLSGKYFLRWTATNSRDSSAFDFGTEITADTTLYAQWVDNNPTVYFVNGGEWATPHVYCWDGEASTAFPGDPMDSTPVRLYCQVGVAWKSISIYKYTITGGHNKVLFNKGDNSAQTGNLTLDNGTVYWFDVDADKFGSVASYLISFMNSMGSHTYNGKTYTNSICGLSSASTFVSTYDSIVSDGDEPAATSIQNSTINTYATPVTSPSGAKADIAMSVLIEQVKKNISGGVYGSLRGFGFLNLNDNSGALIIVIVASLGILSVGAYYFFKKSKKAEE